MADGELKRLRLLEANHLKELAALKKEQEEKLEGLSKRLEEVERQRLSLQQEVTTKSNELSATAKRWLGELSALDRGLAGESFVLCLPLCRLSAVGCRLRFAAGGRNLIFSISPSSGWGQSVLAGCRQALFRASESPSSGWGQSDLAGCRQAYFRTSKICIFQLISALMASDMLFFFAAAFPEAQEEALAAVGRAREDRRQATGEQSSDCFTMDDYLSSIAARVEPVTKLGWELRKAAEELIRLLWPTETLPEDLSNLIAWLDRAPDRFLDWKESATRAGADMALSFVLSWYNEVSLDQLEFRRADVEDKLPAEDKAARLARACAIADFVDKSIFIADPNPPSDDEEEAEDEEADDVPEDDPAAGSADAPPAGPGPAGA